MFLYGFQRYMEISMFLCGSRKPRYLEFLEPQWNMEISMYLYLYGSRNLRCMEISFLGCGSGKSRYMEISTLLSGSRRERYMEISMYLDFLEP